MGLVVEVSKSREQDFSRSRLRQILALYFPDGRAGPFSVAGAEAGEAGVSTGALPGNLTLGAFSAPAAAWKY